MSSVAEIAALGAMKIVMCYRSTGGSWSAAAAVTRWTGRRHKIQRVYPPNSGNLEETA
jgi:hypothetical protein